VLSLTARQPARGGTPGTGCNGAPPGPKTLLLVRRKFARQSRAGYRLPRPRLRGRGGKSPSLGVRGVTPVPGSISKSIGWLALGGLTLIRGHPAERPGENVEQKSLPLVQRLLDTRVAPCIPCGPCRRTSYGKRVKQRFGLFQITGVEALSEPAVDRSQKICGLIRFALSAQKTRHA